MIVINSYRRYYAQKYKLLWYFMTACAKTYPHWNMACVNSQYFLNKWRRYTKCNLIGGPCNYWPPIYAISVHTPPFLYKWCYNYLPHCKVGTFLTRQRYFIFINKWIKALIFFYIIMLVNTCFHKVIVFLFPWRKFVKDLYVIMIWINPT